MEIRAARRMDGIERTLIRQIFDAAPKDAINLGLGQPDLPTPRLAADAGLAGIAAGRTFYTSTAGDPSVRAAIAARYAPFASGPGNVVVTVGSQEAMFAAALTLVDAGDEILYPDPGYPAYPVVARLIGAAGVPYPLRPERDFRIDPADVEARLTARSRLVIVCSPSNPTGGVNRDEETAALATALERRGVPWLSDEIYGGFCYEGREASLRHHAPGGGVVISGIAKDLSMTGWRIGWVVGPESIVARIIAAHQYLVTCAPSVSQWAALATFTPEGDAERARYLGIFRARRSLMAEELGRIPGVRFRMPAGAFYFFVDVSRFGASLDLAKRILERRNVVTIPGEAFGANGRGYLRISYAASEADIVRGVRLVGEELASIG